MDVQIKSWEDYQETYKRSIENPEDFWGELAETFTWQKKWDKVLEWEFDTPDIKWFQGGQLNVTENCLDRHLEERGDQVAILWEPNDPSDKVRKFTYKELHAEVCKMANMLKNLGIKKGDRVCLYMPMIPELAISVLACARIGAIHSVVFAGFSAKALASRIEDAQAKVLLTADGSFRGKKTIPLKDICDEAMNQVTCVDSCVVYKRTGLDVNMQDGRDIWWKDALSGSSTECPAEVMNAEDILFILYTSGSTGKPKGVVHTCAGYLLYIWYTFLNVFQYQDGDIYWCTADIGWITGHSYIVYGPLAAGATTVMFEGTPTYPDPGRFWAICDKHKVNQLYTAPTAIRALMAKGLKYVKEYSLDSIKVIGSVGEPINEEAWQWYHKNIGKSNSPLVDTWWQTENGGILISPIPFATDNKPTYASYPLPGIQAVILDDNGKKITEPHVEGYLCVKFPWPSIIRSIYGDHERCKEVYFSKFKGYYFSGDSAKMDKDGRIRVIGRVDDVINVSGHRLGTAEVEDAINTHDAVVESAVIGYPHDIKGEAIFAYVIPQDPPADTDTFIQSIKEHVNKEIGPIARPEKILLVNDLPKTRSGKIMRRILRKVAAGNFEEFGDISTLLNPEAVEYVVNRVKEM